MLVSIDRIKAAIKEIVFCHAVDRIHRIRRIKHDLLAICVLNCHVTLFKSGNDRDILLTCSALRWHDDLCQIADFRDIGLTHLMQFVDETRCLIDV